MKGLVISLTMASVTLAGCQKAKMKSVQPQVNPSVNVSGPPPVYNPPPYYPPPTPNDPPPPVTIPDETDGTIRQPPNDPPPPVNPPPRNPPPTYNPPPVNTPPTYSNPPPTYNPPPQVNNPPVQPPPPKPNIPVKQEFELPPVPPSVTKWPATHKPAEPPAPIPVSGECTENQPCPEFKLPDPIAGQCTPVDFREPKAIRKLDILLVVDTSASLRGGKNRVKGGELKLLAEGMTDFVMSLSEGVDYRIAVLPAHGSKSSYHGKLFSSGKGDPVVLKFDKSLGSDRLSIARKITKQLSDKMVAVPQEKGGIRSNSAQGEAMLLSLYNIAKKKELLSRAKDQGFFRSDAALTVIAMSDEQDTCANPELGRRKFYKQGKNEVAEINPIEAHFYKNFCKTEDGRLLDSATNEGRQEVISALSEIARQRVTVNAMVYTNNEANGRNLPVPYGTEDDNERGNGILELAQETNGRLIDFDLVDRQKPFSAEMSSIGQLAELSLRWRHRFGCEAFDAQGRRIHPNAIDMQTLDMRVYDHNAQQIAQYSGGCKNGNCGSDFTGAVRGQERVLTENGQKYQFVELSVDPNSMNKVVTKNELDVTGCDIDERTGESKTMKAPLAQRKCPSAEVSFKTKPEIDPYTGKYVEGYDPKKEQQKKKAAKQYVASKKSKSSK